MSGVKGRRFATVVYGPRGEALGGVAHIGEGTDGLTIQWVEYPEGATLGSHVFVTGADGVPVWVPVADIVSTGSPVTIEDGMGGFLIVFTEDGEVVNA